MKVLLVDDEIFTIRMLQSVISWSEMGLELMGYAQNGEDAYSMVLEETPDIIISDVRMPGMDGLEFLRKVYAFNPGIKTILMSAYADFSYVKEGLKLGCSDYILKPVDETELEHSLRKVIYTIQGEKEQEKVVAKSVKQLDNMNLYRYMKTGYGKNKILKLEQETGLKEYCVFMIRINNMTMNEYSSAANIELFQEGYYSRILEKIAAGCCERAYVFDYEENCWTLLLGGITEPDRETVAKRLAEELKRELGFSVNICFSVFGHGLEELPGLYDEVQNLIKYSFYIGDEEILGYDYNCSREELSEVRAIGMLRDMERAVKNENTEAAESKPVKDSIELIEKNYNQNLSLEDICAQAHVSKTYFCYLFKREMGMSVWNYLTVVRLQRAKELLERTQLRSYEIAFQVGYDNPSYFSKVFKKYENMTPNEYRESRRSYGKSGK